MQNFMHIIINVSSALVLGVLIDRTYHYAKGAISAHFRILLQFMTLILAVYLVDFVYKKIHFGSIVNSVFFISIFLGVQTSLFRDIDNLADKSFNRLWSFLRRLLPTL